MLEDIKFNLYLIRHGESEINAQPDKMGQSADVKLTELGKEQARLLRQHMFYGKDNQLKFSYDFSFSSPYTRAMDTAMITLGTNYIRLAPELREYDAGDWTSCSRIATLTTDTQLKMGYQNMGFKPPNGESQTMVERRASEWLEREILYSKEMLNTYYKYNKANNKPLEILAFTHGMTIKCLLHYVLGFDKSFCWKIEIDNTSVTKLSFGDKGWKLGYTNDTSHLK